MSKFLMMPITLVIMLFAVSSFAWDPPASPAPSSWISDPSGVLSPSAHVRLDIKLRQINQSSANELAALVLPTLDGQNIEDVANATFKSWGVGKKDLDNGVLVVLAMKEHKSRIETGKGVEGDFPDLKTQDVLQGARPWLRKGDVEGALGFIFDSAASTIANHKAEAAARQQRSSGPAPVPATSGGGSSCDVSSPGESQTSWPLLIGTGFLLVAMIWYFVRQSQKRRELMAQVARELEADRAVQPGFVSLRKKDAEQLRRHLEDHKEGRIIDDLHHQPVPANPDFHIHPPPLQSVPSPVVETLTFPRQDVVLASGSFTPDPEVVRRLEEERAREQEEAEARRERRAEARREMRVKEQRAQDEEDARRARRKEESSSSSSSGSSNWDTGSSSSDWGSSGGSGGFGGGDSGGGGSSSSW